MDGVGDRDEVVVELAGSDLVEKQPLGLSKDGCLASGQRDG